MTPRGLVIALGFGLLALAVHVAAFAALGPRGAGANAAGAGGQDAITLEATSPAFAAMVQAFDRPAIPTPQLVLPQAVPDGLVPAPKPVEAAPAPEPAPTPRSETVEKSGKDQAAAAGTNAQRAAGSGGGTHAGVDGKAQAGTLSRGALLDLRAQWGASIRARIERSKLYPASAQGARGRATVRLIVTRAGDLAGVSLTKSSGNAALDRAALEAVKRAGRFPAAPPGLTSSVYTFALPIQFAR